MGTYTFLPHTADEKFKVEAKDMDDAFATSLSAFYEIILGKTLVEKKETRDISLRTKKLTSLLYDFLNELVFYFDDEGLLLQYVDSLTIKKDGEEFVLEARLTGDKQYDYELVTEIKNMTYSEMEIKETTNGVELTAVVDI